MIGFLLIVASAWGQEPPPTVPVPAGETARAEVESYLVPRERLERLTAMAQVGVAAEDALSRCRASLLDIEACAEDVDSLRLQLAAVEQTALELSAGRDRMRRQRDAALAASGIVALATAAALAGAIAAGG